MAKQGRIHNSISPILVVRGNMMRFKPTQALILMAVCYKSTVVPIFIEYATKTTRA